MSSEKLRQGSDYNLERLWKPLACIGQFLKIAAVSSATNGTKPDLAGGGLPCQGCLLPLLTIPGAGGCRDGWMQIGSLRGGLHVWSETKIITALLVTMSLALPLDVFFQFPHQPLSPLLSCPLCYCHIILSTTYHDSSRNFQRASINNSE